MAEPAASSERLTLAAGDYRLVLDPALGGSIARFDWRGMPLLRPSAGASILDAACFPLVPFSNRIANGRFAAGGREIQLSPNMPSVSALHPLHGYGWLAPWVVVAAGAATATLAHTNEGGDWPWPYRAEQCFSLTETGISIRISLTNMADNAMPAGLGIHPYFPRNGETRYRGLHCGEWLSDGDCLPVSLDLREVARDWWQGRSVASRSVDTVYVGRSGALEIVWPDRSLALTMTPSPLLGCTAVYVPEDADFFCAEPVSHETNSVNREGMQWLAPGAQLDAEIRIQASAI